MGGGGRVAGDVIVTVTLNAALHVSYTAGGLSADGVHPISRPGYRAGGRGVTAARVLRSFGHDVLAAGLAGGSAGELIREDLARSGVPTAFTLIRGESRRVLRFTGPGPAGQVLRFGEPGPYITTEELGRFAADYRSLLAGAAAVVLCGSLPDGLPSDIYGTLVTYAAEAGLPVILDAGGEELRHAVGHGPDLVVAEVSPASPGPAGPGPAGPYPAGPGPAGPGLSGSGLSGSGLAGPDLAGLAAALVRLGAGAAAVASGNLVRAVTTDGDWTARVISADGQPPPRAVRGALVAGLVPGQLLGWSWPDRLRHALALAAGGLGDAGRDEPSAAAGTISTSAARDHVDLVAYERLLDSVTVERSPRNSG